MRFEGEFSVPGKPDDVIRRFADVERMARCMPGAVIEGRDEEGNYPGGMLVAFGPKKIRFRAASRWRPTSPRMTGSLRGRGAADMRAARIEVRISYALRDDPATHGRDDGNADVGCRTGRRAGGLRAHRRRAVRQCADAGFFQACGGGIRDRGASSKQRSAEPVPLAAHGLLWQVIKAKLAQFVRWLGVARA